MQEGSSDGVASEVQKRAFIGGGEVINIYICNVTGINTEFKIGMKNFMVMSKAEDGNIFKAEAPANSPPTAEAPTAPLAVQKIENEEA